METVEQRLEGLRGIGLFAALPAARLRAVAEAAEVARFGAGEVIVRQGDPGDAVYALTAGTAEVWLEDAQQGRVLLRTMQPGQLFGETAVLYQGLRSATIQARTAVTALRLTGSAFLDLVRQTPELALRVAVILAQRLASDRRKLAAEPAAADPR
jgi:CRP-like cAMP-binding protein